MGGVRERGKMSGLVCPGGGLTGLMITRHCWEMPG